ncbi:MAG: hypothetical protein E7554_05115 [Ruminococcaceae bacterium]|nr:hypothetical protein [Oscillospiraceae bacterium]
MNNRDMKIKKGLLAAVLICIAGCLLLGACGSCDSCISSCALLRSIWTPKLTLTGEPSTPLPVISHSRGSDELTERLEEYYTPIIESVQSANSADDSFTLEHELVKVDNSHYLHSTICCDVGGEIALPRIYIPYCGETEIPGWSVPEELDGPVQTAAWLELTANGVEFDLSLLDDELTMAEITEIFVNYYRDVSGREIDVSRFADTVDYDLLCREAMVLEIIGSQYEYEDENQTTISLIGTAAAALSDMYNYACGMGSTGYTDAELRDTIETFVRYLTVDDEQWSHDSELFLETLEKLSRTSGQPVSNAEMTRMATAATLVNIYEMVYGTIELEESDYWWVHGTDDEDCVKAVKMGFLSDFPGYDQTSPDYVHGRYYMPGIVDDFLWRCIVDNAGEDIWECYATGSDVMQMLAAVDICARRAGISEDEPIVVNNSRDYDWYYTQHGTGWYSSVNCMPTITMMATKWYDQSTTVTIEEMRDRYIPENTGGWYTWQVAECLTENGVPNELVDVSEDFLHYLDEGKIILSQMTEAADGDSGHCFVIYGYWKLGDTIRYFVHDPDVYDGIDEFGQRPGKAMMLDGRYCDWIIDRIAFSYIVVG